jgi:plasmid stability protein
MSAVWALHVDGTMFASLHEHATAHGRSPEAEANAILLQALRLPAGVAWAKVNAIRERRANAGRSFTDSADLLCEAHER